MNCVRLSRLSGRAIERVPPFPDLEAANIEFARAEEVLQQIWSKAVIATSGTHTTMLLLPALNQMFDIAITPQGG